MSSERVETALELLRAEYLKTPTLLLNTGEAAELLDLTRPAAVAVLQTLEDSGFLALTPDGRFGRSPDRPRAATGASSRAKGACAPKSSLSGKTFQPWTGCVHEYKLELYSDELAAHPESVPPVVESQRQR